MNTHDNTPNDDTLADEVFVERDATRTGADAAADEPTPTGEPPTSASTQALPTTPSGSEAAAGAGVGAGASASAGAEASAGAPSTPGSSPGTAVATAAPATGTAAASDSATPGTASTEQQWLRGPAPFAIVLGLLGLFVAGAVLLAELTDLSMPWNDLGPWTVVAAGIVVVLVGAIGLRSSRRAQD
jgi:hypothetical protein